MTLSDWDPSEGVEQKTIAESVTRTSGGKLDVFIVYIT